MITVNILEEVNKAKQKNYVDLFNHTKACLLKQHAQDIDLFIKELDGTFNEMTKRMIEELKDEGLVDDMYMPITFE